MPFYDAFKMGFFFNKYKTFININLLQKHIIFLSIFLTAYIKAKNISCLITYKTQKEFQNKELNIFHVYNNKKLGIP